MCEIIRDWRAPDPGTRTLRAIFDEPIDIRQIRVCFRETEKDRTQEFALSWSDSIDGRPAQILRQQWNFSPSGATEEVEDYTVDLKRVRRLEIHLIPDIRGGDAVASIKEWSIR